MANSTFTMEQAQSLVDTGAMDESGIRALAEQGKLKVFSHRIRNADEKPAIVLETHEKLVGIINDSALDLFFAGYRPAIVWKKAKKDEDENFEG
jgi:hypothetical protein